MSKPLELTIYPYVDRWVPYTVEYLGKQVSGESREYGYETPRGVLRGDEFPEKRLTHAELAAEYWALNQFGSLAQFKEAASGEPYSDEFWDVHSESIETLYRFATLPHYDQEPA